ncbi:MAG: ubiquitin carboxyl-terminal hydrolase [Oscillospiraceae bacterium]|nr:ubiquitin carboxyl-terminal hydrolase [Oscillospiraceae bacterium]
MTSLLPVLPAKYEKVSPHSGLKNTTGSMCYINTAIQTIIRSCPKNKALTFADKLINSGDTFSKSFGELIKNLLNNAASVVDTANFVKEFKIKNIDLYKSNDSENFVIKLIEHFKLKEELDISAYISVERNTGRVSYSENIQLIYYPNCRNMDEVLEFGFNSQNFKRKIKNKPNFIYISATAHILYRYNPKNLNYLNIKKELDLTRYTLNNENLKYNLKSFSRFTPGHYSAYVEINKNWFEFDDSNVKQISEKEALDVASKNGCYFIYEIKN